MPTWGIRGHSLRSGSWERGSQQQPDTQPRCSSPLSWVTTIIMCVCHHDLSISMIKISEISPLGKSCYRKESQTHRVLVQPQHRQRWRQRHLFTKDNKFCFDNFPFWRLLQRKRETRKLERSFRKTNLDRLSSSWSFSKAELPRGCII